MRIDSSELTHTRHLQKPNPEKWRVDSGYQGWGGWGKWGDTDQTVQTSRYGMKTFGDLKYSTVIIVNKTALHT